MGPRCGTSAALATVIAVAGGCVGPPVAAVPPAPAAVAAAPTTIAVAPAAAPCTLAGFLGLDTFCAAVGQDVKHKLAFFGQYFPFLEPKPPLKLLTDPANLTSPVPAIAAAAEIKAEQDLAPQKIKALKYLATIGCGGCYADVEEALLAALDDCTEEVRFEAVNTIYMTAGNPCIHCNSKACCSPRLRKRLAEIAFEGMPCPKEPSPRVRRMARVALNACGGPRPEEPVPEVPTEVVPTAPSELAPEEPVPPPPPPDAVAEAPPETIRRRASAPERPAVRPDPIEPASMTEAAAKMEPNGRIVPPFRPVATPAEAAPAAAQEVEPVRDEPMPQNRASLDRTKGEGRAETAGGVSEDELLLYFAGHIGRYERPEEVRWDSLSADLADFATAEEAHAVMDYVRSRAVGRQAAPPESYRPDRITARRHSWTARSEIGSPQVAAELFGKPAGAVSGILTDGERLILVRVLDSRSGSKPAFRDVADRVRRDFLAEQAELPEETGKPLAIGRSDGQERPAELGKDSTENAAVDRSSTEDASSVSYRRRVVAIATEVEPAGVIEAGYTEDAPLERDPEPAAAPEEATSLPETSTAIGPSSNPIAARMVIEIGRPSATDEPTGRTGRRLEAKRQSATW